MIGKCPDMENATTNENNGLRKRTWRGKSSETGGYGENPFKEKRVWTITPPSSFL